MVTLRDAVPGDAVALAALAERTFRDTFAESNTAADIDAHCASNFGPDRQLAEIEDSGWTTVVAAADDGLVGFGQLRWSRPPDCVPGTKPQEIARLYMDKAFHGRGLAPRLMDALLTRAAAAGADVIWLGVWEHNPRAIAFYRKSAFEEAGDHSFLRGSDRQRDIVMCRQLSPAAGPRH
jgi:ribosomal protein S18 acetylase RimI-like enzyme